MTAPANPNSAIPAENPKQDFHKRCDAIEESYEFMLAYAAQGVSGQDGDGQAREFLKRAATALSGLAAVLATTITRERLEPAERYLAFHSVLERDARDALAAVELVLAQPAVSSQLVDNLNASIHLRALLTDLFLVDEALKGLPDSASAPARLPHADARAGNS
jgi:hypothetical protein